jgi:hypothetical protein
MRTPISNGILSYVNYKEKTKYMLGRAIAQAVSRWLPTATSRVRARVWSCGIGGGQSGAGAGFLQVLPSPLPIFIPPIAPQSPSSIIWSLNNRPVVAAVPSGLSPTPLIIILLIIKLLVTSSSNEYLPIRSTCEEWCNVRFALAFVPLIKEIYDIINSHDYKP